MTRAGAMREGLRFAIAVVLALGCSATVNAQVTGSRTAPKPAEIPDSAKAAVQQARQTLLQFTACTIHKDRVAVQRFLDAFPDSPEATKMVPSLMRDDCLSVGEMRFTDKLFRWSAYDLLYRQDFGERAPDPAAFSVVPAFASPIDLDSATAPQRQTVALAEMGDCIVRRSPDDARRLALSPVATQTEGAAFGILMPAISACVPKDSTITFSKEVLRGLVVEALYKLSQRAAAAASLPAVTK